MDFVEMFGVIASLLILMALVIKDDLFIRILNFVGSAMFCIYGIMIDSLSVCLLYGIMTIILLYQILKGTDKK